MLLVSKFLHDCFSWCWTRSLYLERLRFGDVVVLQMRTVVEPEYLGWRLAAFLQKDPNDIDCHGSDFQGAIDCLAIVHAADDFSSSRKTLMNSRRPIAA